MNYEGGYTPHLWIIALAILALATVYLIEARAARTQVTSGDAALMPVFSPPRGTYNQDIRLHIQPPHPNADILFTIDGSVPTYASGTVYTRPLHLSAVTPAVTVIRARAVLPEGQLGPVASASYFVGLSTSLPLLSLIIEPDDLWDPQQGIYANPYKRGMAWERPVDVTYVDQGGLFQSTGQSGFHIPAGVRIHGEWSRNYDKKALRLYFRQEYGQSWLEYPLFDNSDLHTFKRLVIHNGGQDWAIPHTNWTLIRNQLAARLAFEVNGYATHSQPALLFINGEAWGIYQIRERIDERFLTEQYNITAADFLETPELFKQRAILMGDAEHWDHLLHFVEAHSLADWDNYAYVESQVDLANFIDYNILQLYAANIDWPHHNVHQFRPRVQGGRWHWMFWDSDHGFAANLYSHTEMNLIRQVLEQDHPETGGRDVLLLRKLLENPAFLQRFLSRAADLLNTTLAPAAVTAQIDSLAAELEPDIAYEAIRWSSSINWASSIQGLRDFAERRPAYVRQHMSEQFGLGSAVTLSLKPPAQGAGTVAVNGMLPPSQAWEGIYFPTIPVQVTAAPAPGYRFTGWEPATLPQTPTLSLRLNAPLTLTPRFAALPWRTPHAGDVTLAQSACPASTAAEADCLTLRVQHPGGVDLRRWRITDNDSKTATNEGSLIFAADPALAHVPFGTTIQVIISPPGSPSPPQDDLSAWDRRMTMHTGNRLLDTSTDPGFKLGERDNLVLLAPGPTGAFGDDRGIAFIAGSPAVTPVSFGVLVDGVWP